MRLKTAEELLLLLPPSLVLLGLLAISWSGNLRVILGLAFLFFFPGYACTSALFPHRRELTLSERMALSLVLSVALMPVAAVVLNYTSWGVRLMPVFLVLLVVMVLASLLAAYRRYTLPAEERFSMLEGPAWLARRTRSMPTQSILLAGAVSIGLGGLVVAVLIGTAGRQTYLTELSMLNPSGKAEEYPKALEVGRPTSVRLVITNREGQRESYRVEVRLDDEVIGQGGPILLEDQATVEETLSFVPHRTGRSLPITVLLFKEGREDAYRTLVLRAEATAPRGEP